MFIDEISIKSSASKVTVVIITSDFLFIGAGNF